MGQVAATARTEQGVSGASGLCGSDLLAEAGRFVRRFVVVSDQACDALALFVAHTHALEAADTTPYIDVHSPLKRCGKSRLLEVLELLVREALVVVNASTSALFRVIEKRQPTLLLDEVDAVFSARGGDKEELRGILNGGYRRGAFVYRMGGARMTTLEEFPVFCPKVLAGIGDLPDTIRDRSIPIRLERRTRAEQVERFHYREVAPVAHELRDRIADWLEPQLDHLRSLRPELPDELDDRAQDIWEPLFAIAEFAGGDWPERARRAALALSTGEEREDDALGVRLFCDVYTVFSSNGWSRIRTADLIAQLALIEESPWGDWYGKAITPQALSRLLRPYRIKTMSVKVDGETVRGYKLEQFEETWLRLGVTGVTTATPEPRSDAEGNAGNAGNGYIGNRSDSSMPTPGDEDFVSLLAEAHRNGRLTEAEAEERWRLHRLLA
jgi:hypothetical protein